METVNLEKLYILQGELDEEIARNHNINYEVTHDKRLLALTVELGELANETRCFKFWSNKGPSAKEVILDEYADGIHFLLSLGIPLRASKFIYELSENNEELTAQFHTMHKLVNELREHYDLFHYEKALQYYLNLVITLGYKGQDIIDSYLNKLAVNHNRQATNY